MDYNPPDSFVHGISKAKSTGVGCRILLQRIFLTQGSNVINITESLNYTPETNTILYIKNQLYFTF